MLTPEISALACISIQEYVCAVTQDRLLCFFRGIASLPHLYKSLLQLEAATIQPNLNRRV